MMLHSRVSRRFVAALLFVPLASAVLRADVKVQSPIGSHMVLQRDRPIPVHGTAARDEEVTVEFAGQTKSARADDKGRWSVTLDPLAAAKQPATLVARGSAGSTAKIEDILVGDVWFGSGQSNMAFTIDHCENEVKDPERRDKVLAAVVAGTHPMVRLHRGNAGWAVSGPDVNRGFSALMLSFGVALQRELDVPVGLSVSAIGARPVTAFMSRQQFEADPACVAARERARNSPEAAASKTERDTKLAVWEEAVRQARAAGAAAPPKPTPAVYGELEGQFGNSAVGHLQGMAIRGVLWDQGESGSGFAWVDQHTIMGALIRGWRAELGHGDVPFLTIQKPNGGGCAWDPADPVTRYAAAFQPLPRMVPTAAIGAFHIRREQHLRLAEYPNTFLVTSTDLGEGTHPIDKSSYGSRAARVALGGVYGRPVAIYGPIYKSHVIDGGKVRVSFTHVGKGLAFRHGEELQGFALAGADRQFHWADATIEGDTVVVSSARVAEPVVVRYAWAGGFPWANLFNKDGLPAVSFRTDDWEEKP
jgi:sialate O-acetylesterase